MTMADMGGEMRRLSSIHLPRIGWIWFGVEASVLLHTGILYRVIEA